MNEITTEQKIQLVQQIRNQNSQNRYDMSARERILYGSTPPVASSNITDTDNNKLIASESLKCRGAIAAMLLIFAIVFEIMGVKLFGMEMEQIFTYISADYVDDVQEYVETMVNKASTVL